MQLQDQTHQAIIIGAKMWESKRGIGSWRRLDGGQKRRAGKAEMATVAEEPSHLSLSLSRTRKLTHTSSFPAGATAHRELVDEEELELGSSGWGARRWDGRNV